MYIQELVVGDKFIIVNDLTDDDCKFRQPNQVHVYIKLGQGNDKFGAVEESTKRIRTLGMNAEVIKLV